MLQISTVMFSPKHVNPPFRGYGLLHVRVRLRFPPPHEVLHEDHGDQSEYPPSTKDLKIILISDSFRITLKSKLLYLFEDQGKGQIKPW